MAISGKSHTWTASRADRRRKGEPSWLTWMLTCCRAHRTRWRLTVALPAGRRGVKDHGALQYMECVADDVEPGKRTSFPRAVKAKPGETVIVAFVVFRSRAARDRINARVMADPRLASLGPKDMPFDTKRMFWGGFKPIVEA